MDSIPWVRCASGNVFTCVCGESESESRWIVDKLVEKGGGRGLARSAEEMDLDRVSVSSAQLAGGN